jgi:hypothetical protein
VLAFVASPLVRDADAMRAGSAFGFGAARVEIDGSAAAIDAGEARPAWPSRLRAALAPSTRAFGAGRARAAEADDRSGQRTGESLQNRPARGEFAR